MNRVLAVLIVLVSAPAQADDVSKRSLPDYDGRGPEPTTVGDVALWIPRVAVAPLYAISELAVRRPVGWIVRTAEREHWASKLVGVFTTDDLRAGVIPMFYVESGANPVAGAYAFANDVGLRGNDLRFSGSIGVGHRAVTVSDRLRRDAFELKLRGHGSTRDDHEIHVGDTRVGYGLRRYEVSAAAATRVGPLAARVELGYRDADFFDAVELEGHDHAGLYERLTLDVDSRGRGATGVRLSLDVEHGPRWNRMAGFAGASAGLGRGRVTSLGVTAVIVEPAGGGEIPVTELAFVGGSGPLPGFTAGRLVGPSALSVVAQYEWPVWSWLSGALHLGAGNVFGERLDGVDPRDFRLSGGLGFRTSGARDHRFEALVAFGSETIRDGADLDTVRLVLGGSHAF